MLRVVAVVLVVLFGSFALADDADQELRGKVKQWIEDLRADAFEVRETARTELKRNGMKARDLLEAARDHEDPEVRRTVRAILARTGSRPRTSVPMQVQDGRFDDVHLVSLDVEDAALEDALTDLGLQIGARFKVPLSARATKVTLQAKNKPPYAVLRALLSQGKLRMSAPFDRTGLGALVLADDSPVSPWAAAGPIQVEVLQVTATRTLGAKTKPRFMLELRVQWIPIVQVAQYQTPKIDKAEDAEGRAFVAGTKMARRVGFGVGTTRRYADVKIHLSPAAATYGDALSTLEITLPVSGLQHDVRRIVLPDVAQIPICLDLEGKEADPGTPETVSFESLELSADRRGQWVANLAATLSTDVAQRTLQASLEQEGGRIHALYVAGGRSRAADGTVQLTARAYGIGSAKPKGMHVSWFRRQESGSIRIKLENVPLR